MKMGIDNVERVYQLRNMYRLKVKGNRHVLNHIVVIMLTEERPKLATTFQEL